MAQRFREKETQRGKTNHKTKAIQMRALPCLKKGAGKPMQRDSGSSNSSKSKLLMVMTQPQLSSLLTKFKTLCQQCYLPPKGRQRTKRRTKLAQSTTTQERGVIRAQRPPCLRALSTLKWSRKVKKNPNKRKSLRRDLRSGPNIPLRREPSIIWKSKTILKIILNIKKMSFSENP